jgi:hypothetical protein
MILRPTIHWTLLRRILLRIGPGLATAKSRPLVLSCSAVRGRGWRGSAAPGGAVDASRRRGFGSKSVQISSVIESAVRARGAALRGVVNTAPDSFFDGGRYTQEEAARARVDELISNTTILDIGADRRSGFVSVPAARNRSHAWRRRSSTRCFVAPCRRHDGPRSCRLRARQGARRQRRLVFGQR